MTRPDLRTQVLASLKWTASLRIVAQMVSWAITLLVMRLLVPGDYGLLALAVFFTGFLMLLNEIGLSAGIVQAGEVALEQLRRIFGALLLLNVGLCVATALIAPLVAAYFGEPQLEPVMQVLGLAFLAVPFGVVPSALLERDMKFRERSIADFTATLVTAPVVLALAYHGFGVWSLVLGNVVQLAWRAAALNALRPFPHTPSFAFRRADVIFVFGRDVFVARLLWFFYSQVDSLLAGKILGKDALGLYAVSMHIASMPVQRISVVVNEIALAAFSQARRESGQVADHMLKATRLMSLVAFPVMLGISSVAEELVGVILGPAWTGAIPILALLCLVMPLRIMGEVIKSAVQSMGRADVVVRNTMVAAIVMPLAFLVGLQFGLIGLALAWVIAFPAVFLQNLAKSAPLLGLAPGDVLRAMARPALAAGVMYAVVGVAREVLHFAPLAELLILSAIGAAAYVTLSLALNRAGVAELFELASSPGS